MSDKFYSTVSYSQQCQQGLMMKSFNQRLSKHVVFWRSFAIGLMISLILIFLVFKELEYRIPYNPINLIFNIVIFYTVNWGIMILAPFVIAILSAISTVNYVRQEAYSLLRLTNLSNRKLVYLCLKKAHQHFANILAFLMGLIPLYMMLAMFPDKTLCMKYCFSVWHYGSPVACVPQLMGERHGAGET
jgi:hypothetical protein